MLKNGSRVRIKYNGQDGQGRTIAHRTTTGTVDGDTYNILICGQDVQAVDVNWDRRNYEGYKRTERFPASELEEI